MPTSNPPTDRALVAWAIGKLAVDFPASFPDEATTKGRLLSLRELLEAHPWVTAPVLERAVYLIRWEHQGPFVPPPARFLDYLHAAVDDLERQRREAATRLPPPPPPTADERRLVEDANELAKLKAWASLPEKYRKRSARRSGGTR